MIIDLPNTKTHDVIRRLREIRDERGQLTSGRVLTLIVVATGEDDLDSIIAATHQASREHPARVLVLVTHRTSAEARLDAEIRLGGDAGASEIIVMHLYGELSAHRDSVVTPLLLPDTPVVAWWPTHGPRNPSTDRIGSLATRRITDSLFDDDPDALYRRRMTYARGDSDMAWSRITLWRGLLASLLDQPPHEDILAAEVSGPLDDPSVDIAAGWLADRLDVPVTRKVSGSPAVPLDGNGNECLGLESIVLRRTDTDVRVAVASAHTVEFTVGDITRKVTLGRRELYECLAEELRHLDVDYAFGHALRGLARVSRPHRGRSGTDRNRYDSRDQWFVDRDDSQFDVQESLR
ncbi:glucose-6-phosphate dehydrogenase assembly protein OpcA [Corynebacterium auriscanis]|uniref:Oxppcycle protein OpcA n=1 Tax=Corynebacterium auriscanis TaxID=99807 RepID=A0A0A2DND4_9CORY|nr:glucose-6-phosphate dehydrogenase assembly protein OpcA [Corynebacterium auriscanis]KGM19297.1 oxppcycle protein OpcA [Corynebacterium auriscanis]MCX2162871.1 glucose-6-phosphate dehydrogenase assembly protein OpcA [Corynebacterium auriscanis]WJY72726.1 Glucose-6-phosphate dehydrogenase subunit [Corynebacterium auriscanis]